jgi:hypothetical protein
VKRGDTVRLTVGATTVQAFVIIGSGRSAMLGFEAIVDGCLGMMPVYQDEHTGIWTNIVTGRHVEIAGDAE